MAPALDLDGTGTNNTLTTVFPTNGVALGDVIFAFNGGGYDVLNYKTVGRGVSAVTGWFLGSTLDNNYPLNPGQAVFYAPAANETNTQVGTVISGTNIANVHIAPANGISLVSSVIPIAGGITSNLQYNPTLGDVIFNYNGSGYDVYNYKTVGRGVSAVTGWFLGSSVVEPQINVGSGAWLQPASTTNWVQTLNLQ